MPRPRPTGSRSEKADSHPVTADAGQPLPADSAGPPDVHAAIECTRRHWELGRSVAELQKEGAGAEGRSKAWPASVRAIARRLGRDPAIARVALHVFEAYDSEAKLGELLKLRRKNKKPIPFSTLALLYRPGVPEERRQELLKRVISENLSENHVKDLLRAEADPERRQTPSGYKPRPPSSLALGLACWGRKARECARYTEAVFGEESIHNLIEKSATSRLNVSDIEGVERDLARAVKATKRQLAAVRAIRKAVEARRAETVPDKLESGSEDEPQRASEPGAARPARRSRRRPDRSGR
jgi:hypothetical protein